VLLGLGYRVVAADISLRALHMMRALSDSLSRVQVDADAWPFGRATFDVVIQVDFLDRRVLPFLLASVKPGGFCLLDTFAGDPEADRTGPRSAAFRLRYGELPTVFADWDLVHFAEHPPPSGRAAVLARRRVGGIVDIPKPLG
jgi:SAM-dependent methyltransferase